MLTITKSMWSLISDEDSDFIKRIKKRLTMLSSDGQSLITLYRDVENSTTSLYVQSGCVDDLILPYFRFNTVIDQRKIIDIDVKATMQKVRQAYNEMALASPGFEVREHQLMGTLKCLINKHGICEAATGCFVGDTLILTNTGFETLQSLSMDFNGKSVFCSDGKFHSIISAHLSKYVKDTLRIKFNDGVVVECTPDHLFLLSNGKYVEAISLLVESPVAGVYGSRIVEQVFAEHYVDPIPVYDIEVDCELHNFALSNGVIVHNSGKTEIISSLFKLIDGKILVINNRTNILNQIEGRAKLRGVTRKIEYLNRNPVLDNSDIIVSTNNLVWNMVKRNDPKIMRYLKSVTAIIVDECHHGACQSIAIPAMVANPEYLIGFTASPFKEGGQCVDDIVLKALFGNSFYYISSKYLRDKGYSSLVYSYYINYAPKSFTYCRSCTDVYKKYIAENFNRNEAAYRCIDYCYRNHLKILVMVNRIEHGKAIVREMKDRGIKSLFMCGGNTIYEAIDATEKTSKGIVQHKVIERKGNAETIKKAIREEGYRVIVGNVVFNEGIDVPEFDVGILMDAGKNIISHVQRIGRVTRRKDKGLNCSVFVDFNDKGHQYIESWVRERKQHLVDEGIPEINEEQFKLLIKKMGESRIG